MGRNDGCIVITVGGFSNLDSSQKLRNTTILQNRHEHFVLSSEDFTGSIDGS